MSHYLMMGLVLGLSAGLAPGPLLTLVVSETLAHDMRAGIRVALAPLISDLPIVAVTMVVLAGLSQFNTVLGIISLVGGAVILKMGWAGLKTSGVTLDYSDKAPRSLSKGVLVNVLSPHPYLFWISVGGPAVTRAWQISPGAAVGFVFLFYLLLVGSKVMLAVLVGRSRSFLSGRGYIWTMKALGLMLCILALFLVKEGLVLLGLM
ncbi:MAG TPA: hypothetical protein DHV36_19105 [Desulfobacteraceae bacterium]|nr:hypothetical protein [Desulfobacteraceae bacterium]